MKQPDQSRLADECAKLDVREEIALAEKGLLADLEQWPKYDSTEDEARD